MAHITGGGLPENIPRVLPDHVAMTIDIASSGWSLPPVFQWLQQETALPQEELTRTFNCGIGMVLVVAPEKEQEVLSALAEANESPLLLGSIVPRTDRDEPQVLLKGNLR